MLDPADRAALLVMDVQPGILDRVPDPAAYLARVTETVFPRQARVMSATEWMAGLA